MSINPKVSICIPTYKQIDFLRRTLESVISQSYTNYEVVVCDDSPDLSVKKLVESLDFRDKLKYFKNERILGSPENWNETVRRSSGEYIKILHHDDFFTDKNSLEKFVALLDSNPLAIFGFSSSIGWNIKENVKYKYQPARSSLARMIKDPDLLYVGNLIGAPSATIFRRGINAEFDIRLKWLVDIDFYIRALKLNSNIAYTSEALITIARGVENQMTEICLSDKETLINENLYLFDKINKSRKEFEDHLLSLFIKYKVSYVDLGPYSDHVIFRRILKKSESILIKMAWKIILLKKQLIRSFFNDRFFNKI